MPRTRMCMQCIAERATVLVAGVRLDVAGDGWTSAEKHLTAKNAEASQRMQRRPSLTKAAYLSDVVFLGVLRGLSQRTSRLNARRSLGSLTTPRRRHRREDRSEEHTSEL